MTTPANAIIALRKIHTDKLVHRKDPELDFVLALGHLDKVLSKYVDELPRILDTAYNVRVRQGNWYSIPFTTKIVFDELNVAPLLWARSRSENAIHKCAGFERLQNAAREHKTLYKISIRSDGVAVTCDFLTETEGEVQLFFF